MRKRYVQTVLTFWMTYVLQTTSIRSDFTKHSLHLNMNGRERMAKLIGKKITSLKNVQQPLPIPLQWRDNCINTAEEEEERHIVTNILWTQSTETMSSRTQKITPARRNNDFFMDKVMNGDLSWRNEDTNSDQQKTDSTWLMIFHQNIRGKKVQIKWTCMSLVTWPTAGTLLHRTSLN